MKSTAFLLVLIAIMLGACDDKGHRTTLPDAFIRGADVSSLIEIEDNGGVFSDNGMAQDCLQILKNHGFNYIRLRIWHNPTDGYCNTARTITLAKRAKALGMGLLLDFHYSDTWADPGSQTIPAAWTNMSYTGVSNAVYSYTKAVMVALKAENALPDMVQIGNEITPGMLWPHGRVGNFNQTYNAVYARGDFNGWGKSYMQLVDHHLREATLTGLAPGHNFKFDGSENWTLQWGETNSDGFADLVTGTTGNIPITISGSAVVQFNETNLAYSLHTNTARAEMIWKNFTDLLKAGIAGVRDSLTTGDAVKIMIHTDRGGDNHSCRFFYDQMADYNVQYDIIGLSYYNWWHGDLDTMQNNINDLAARYARDIIVVETSYPWTLDWNDSVNNQVGLESQLHPGYPATVAGQKAFLEELISRIRQVPANRGSGLFYWEPAGITTPTLSSSRENQALFDFSGKAIDSLNAFK